VYAHGKEGVDGSSPSEGFDDPDPGHDIVATSLSLVRTLPHGHHGTTYPDVPWEPKQAFHAVADYYAQN
jgi:hypothetical protein